MVFDTLLASLSQVGKEHDTGGVEFWREPMRAGWLMKQGDVIRTWRRRWFVLKDGKLFWFLDSNVTPASKTRGVIDMRYCLSAPARGQDGQRGVVRDHVHGRESRLACGRSPKRRLVILRRRVRTARASRSFAH